MKYYWLNYYDNDQAPVAFAPEGSPLGHDLIRDLNNVEVFPYPLRLYEVNGVNRLVIGELTDNTVDYLPNSFAFPLMSEKMRSVIETHLYGTECVRWILAPVYGKSVLFNYYIPMFSQKMDTLNHEKTILAPYSGIVLHPCFDSEKIKHYAMFHGESIFWQITLKIYVNETIRKALKQAHITSIQLNPVKVL